MTTDKSHLYFQKTPTGDSESLLPILPKKSREEVEEIVTTARDQDKTADLTKLDLKGVNLSFMNLRGVDLRGSDLREAILVQSILSEADLTGANLSEVKATRTRLDRVQMYSERSKNLEQSLTIHNTKLNNANFTLATFYQASMRGVEALEVNMSGTDLSEAILFEANLALTNLTWANLRAADLRGANLGWVDLQGANLADANLNWAELQGAYLIETNLSGADLSTADLFRAKYDADTNWPEKFTPKGSGAIEEKYVTYHPDYP